MPGRPGGDPRAGVGAGGQNEWVGARPRAGVVEQMGDFYRQRRQEMKKIIVGTVMLILLIVACLFLAIQAKAATLASNGSQSSFQVTETLVVIEPEGTESTWFAQYIVRIKYNGVLVARKRLCITAKLLDA